MSIWEIFGIDDPNDNSGTFYKPDPKKGDYRDIKPAGTQVEDHGKTFTDNAAARSYARMMGKKKPCPSCHNHKDNRVYCSTCGGTGEVDLNYGVF